MFFQHKNYIATQEKEQSYHLLRQIHQFKNNKLHSPSYSPSLDDPKEQRDHYLENVQTSLAQKIEKTKEEALRLKVSLQRKSFPVDQTSSLSREYYLAIQTNQYILKKFQHQLQYIQQLTQQSIDTPLTFDQQLVIANYIHQQIKEKEEIKQALDLYKLEHDHLKLFEKVLHKNCTQEERLTYVREALFLILSKVDRLQTSEKGFRILKSKLEEAVTEHTCHLSIDALLLLEQNILDLERQASHCTITINDTNQTITRLGDLIQQITQTIESGIWNTLYLGIKTLTKNIASEGFRYISFLKIRDEMDREKKLVQYRACFSLTSLVYNSFKDTRRIEKKQLFMEALEKEIQSQVKLLPLLELICQKVHEESTIPTEALTFCHQETFYLKAQTDSIQQKIEQLRKDRDFLRPILSWEDNPSKSWKYSGDVFRPVQCLVSKNCSAHTQTLFTSLFQEGTSHASKCITNRETAPKKHQIDLASLTPTQAKIRLYAIQRRREGLNIAYKNNKLLISQFTHNLKKASLTKRETLKYLTCQQKAIRQEQELLQIEQQLVENMTQSHVLIREEDTQLHDDAYNRRELVTACEQLKQQITTVTKSCQILDQTVKSIENSLSAPKVAGSSVLLPLLEIRLKSILSKRSNIVLDLYGLHDQLENHTTTIQQREKLARLLNITTKLVLESAITIVVTTSTGPFAIVLLPAAKAATITCISKATEDLVMNGGDLTGFGNDFVSWNTAHQVSTTFLSSIATQGLVQVIPLGAKKALPAIQKKLPSIQKKLPEFFQKELPEDLLKNLTNFMGKVKKDPLSVHWGKRIPTQALRHFHDNFAGNISHAFVGMGIKEVIENCTGKDLHTGLPTENPQNPNYATAHSEKSCWQMVKHATGDAFLQSLSATAANNIGAHYQEHKNDNDKKATWIGYGLHKGAHATVGATTAVAQKVFLEGNTHAKEVIYAAISGATGAVCSEAIAEYHLNLSIEGGQLVKDLEAKNITPTLENIKTAYQQKVIQSGTIGKMGAITATYALDLDIETAYRAADNAIENNFAEALAAPVAIALLPELLIGGAIIVTVGGIGYLVVAMAAEHTKNKSKSKKDKHEKGQAAKKKPKAKQKPGWKQQPTKKKS